MSEEANLYRRALRLTAIGLAALAVIAIPIGLLIGGAVGLLAAEVGVGVAAIAGLTTQAAMMMGHRRTPHMMAAIVLGSWLLKMIIIVIVLLVLQGVDGFHKGLFAVFMLVGVFGTIAADLWAVKVSRVPYVDPSSK